MSTPREPEPFVHPTTDRNNTIETLTDRETTELFEKMLQECVLVADECILLFTTVERPLVCEVHAKFKCIQDTAELMGIRSAYLRTKVVSQELDRLVIEGVSILPPLLDGMVLGSLRSIREIVGHWFVILAGMKG